MRLPPVPGPRDLWQLVERSADSVEQLLGAVPRITALLDEAEALLTRTGRLLEDIETTREAAQQVVDRSSAVTRRAEAVLDPVSSLTDRLRAQLDSLEPPLTRFQPVLERLAETTSPREVDATVHLANHLPALADLMENQVLPVLDGLGTVAPDLHDLLDISRELNEMLGQIPGLGRLKRRVDEQQEAGGHG